MRPLFKVFGAQSCSCRSQRTEHEDIKFFEIEQRLPLPLGAFRWLQLYIKYIFYVTKNLPQFLKNTHKNKFTSINWLQTA